ncbi:DUF3488 and transglutaminase-like domain-containing protein [Calidifontibacter terrae]
MLAALATIVAAWPLTTLIQGNRWLGDLVVLILGTTVFAICWRLLRLPEVLLLPAQVISVGATVWAFYVRTSGSGALDVARTLANEADHTIRSYAAPAPETTGLTAAVVLFVGLLAVLTEYIAVSLASPAVAGLPLMSIYLVSAANSVDGLAPLYFAAAAGAWLLLLAVDEWARISAWATNRTRPTTPSPLADRIGLAAFSSTGRIAAALAIIGALLLPPILPSNSAQFIGDGLGRSGSGARAGVGLSSTADLAKSLVSNSKQPVLTYRSTEISPAVLRVFVASDYSNGVWNQRTEPETRVGSNDSPIPPAGMDDISRFGTEQVTIDSSTLQAGQIAAPAPPVRVSMPGSWTYEPSTSVIHPRSAAQNYAVTYPIIGSAARPSSNAAVTDFPEQLLVPQRAIPALNTALRQVAPATNKFDRARNIQDWFRGEGGFSYDLQLAPTRKDATGRNVDPLTNFLLTKQGYCVQFASAMIMMARLEGIPARMALGFLSGTPNTSGTFTVVQADAHAWPELYFPGMGWTRFEPTPGSRSGDVPMYAQSTASVSRNTQGTATSKSVTSSTASSAATSTTSAPTAAAGGSHPQWWQGLGWVVLVALVLGALGALLPALSRWGRSRERSAADNPQRQAEIEWTQFQDDLADLGVPRPRPSSPRAQLAHYRRTAGISGAADGALQRATATLERARYARPEDSLDVHEDSKVVVESVRRNASWRRRVLAAVAPRSALRYLPGRRRNEPDDLD